MYILRHRDTIVSLNSPNDCLTLWAERRTMHLIQNHFPPSHHLHQGSQRAGAGLAISQLAERKTVCEHHQLKQRWKACRQPVAKLD